MKKAVSIIIGIFLVTAAASGVIIYFYLDSFSHKNTPSGDNSGFIEAKESKSGEPINVLLLGVDVGVAGSKSSPKRSDTMIVLHYDPKSAEIALVSIPRDTKVTINGDSEKINAANAFGGPELAVKSVEKLLNIGVNYYVEINYQGFRKLIDAIGGIDVVIDRDMNYDDSSQNLHIHFKKGQKVHLDGKKAEEFVRWRKNNDGTGYADGDLGRIKTQQDFMVKVVEKLKSPAIIPNIFSIAKILPQYIDTNMDPMTMANLAKDIPRLNNSAIQKFTIQGEPKVINGIWYFVYEPDKNKDITALLNGKTAVASSKSDNKSIKIQILNGSGINGAGDRVKKDLELKGYTVSGVGSISGVKFASSHIIDKTAKGANAKQVARELLIEHIEKAQDELSKTDIVVILGSDVSKMLN